VHLCFRCSLSTQPRSCGENAFFGWLVLYPTVTECAGQFYINNSFQTKFDLEILDFDTIKANALAMFFKSLNG
jgi:hypothetical protein